MMLEMPQFFTQFFAQYGVAGMAFFIALIAWSIAWKGYALWTSARREEEWWFVAILLINTIGILEIIYIFFFVRRKKESTDTTTPQEQETASESPSA